MEKVDLQILGKGIFPQRNVKGQVGGSSWIGTALAPNPFPSGVSANLLFKGTSTSGGTFALIGKKTTPAGAIHLAIYGERHSKDLMVCHVDIIEAAQPDLGLAKIDLDYLESMMKTKGMVSIYGIEFDYNSSQLRESARPIITEMALYLKGNAEVRLYVVGHTDMQGSLDYNLTLSKARAKAVVQALIEKHQIQSNRLEAQGVAFLAPKGNNQTESGRALNRRTDLVLKVN